MEGVKMSLYSFWPIGLFFVGITVFLFLFLEILLPFTIGMIFAYIFHPLVSKIETVMKIPRSITASTLVLAFFSGLVLFFVFLIPYIQSQLVYFARHMPEYIQATQAQITKIGSQFSDFLSDQDLIYMKEGISNTINSLINWSVHFVSGVLSKSSAAANILALILITPIVAIFFLKDWPKFVWGLEHLLPRRYSATAQQLLKQINQKLALFARGQVLIGFILIVYYALVLSILKVDGALLIALISGLFSFIPYFAISFGFISAFLSGFFADFSSLQNVGLLCVYICGGILEGAVLGPLLIGNSIGLHPLWILFSVMAGAKIAGFMGVLIAVPTAAILGVIIRFGISKYLDSSYYQK
jgi:predicted PurR-regulated permease PerM